MRDLYLIRHAESAPTPGLPTADWPLSDKGVLQAQALVKHFAAVPIVAVFSSPYRRAVDTVAPLAAQRALNVQHRHDLREHDLVHGYVADINACVAAAWADFELVQSGGESARQCQQRLVACLHDIARECSSLPPSTRRTRTSTEHAAVLVGSHGNAIGFVLQACSAMAASPEFKHADWAAMQRPDVFRLQRDGNAWHWDRSYVFAATAGFDGR